MMELSIRSALTALLKHGIWLNVPFGWTGVLNMKDRLVLLDAIHLAFNHPEYAPKDGTTHCNQYVNEVCETYGFKGLIGRPANDICDFLEHHSEWKEIKLDEAQFLANEGTLIIAGNKGTPHGHVVVVCPGHLKFSGRWGSVPSCASVGWTNTIGRGINWAFAQMPKFWAWNRSL